MCERMGYKECCGCQSSTQQPLLKLLAHGWSYRDCLLDRVGTYDMLDRSFTHIGIYLLSRID